MHPPSPPPIRYKAFLSYSTADEELARWLMHELERWRTPKPLIGQPSRHGGAVPSQLGRICRDRDEFPTAPFVDTVIREKLRESEQLIILCTEHSADPRSYVDREIGWFMVDRPGGAIHAIISGSPPECFPKSLRSQPPLAGDLRSRRHGGDGKQRALVKLIAGLLGVEVDALWQRERRRRVFRGIAYALIGAASLVVVTALGYTAVDATLEAIARQKDVDASNDARAALADSRDLFSLTNWRSEGLTMALSPDFRAPLSRALKAARRYEQAPHEAPPIVFAALREALLRAPPWGATLRHSSQPLWVEWQRNGKMLMSA
ncbi:MAG: TIR domain-containing protein, partial [Candidatus Accumulibacter sp.]|nr:TIR domain-containing protein [Accumulibacter sp.]